MTTLPLNKPHKGRAASRRKAASAYQRVVHALSVQVKEWAESFPGWMVTQEETIQNDAQLGSGLHVTTTTIDTPQGRLILEPMGLSIGQNAIVDFLAWPTSYHVRLLHDLSSEGAWRVRTESGIFLRDPWNRESFLQLSHDLLAADWE